MWKVGALVCRLVEVEYGTRVDLGDLRWRRFREKPLCGCGLSLWKTKVWDGGLFSSASLIKWGDVSRRDVEGRAGQGRAFLFLGIVAYILELATVDVMGMPDGVGGGGGGDCHDGGFLDSGGFFLMIGSRWFFFERPRCFVLCTYRMTVWCGVRSGT